MDVTSYKFLCCLRYPPQGFSTEEDSRFFFVYSSLNSLFFQRTNHGLFITSILFISVTFYDKQRKLEYPIRYIPRKKNRKIPSFTTLVA